MEPLEGICVACERGGPVAAPCPNALCRRRGFHFVPLTCAPEGHEVPDGRIGQMWDTYLLVEKLGDGGVGAVYRALQPPIMLEAAVKVLSTEAPASLIERFRHEAAALARLNHPNIVRLLHFGRHRDEPFLVMELVPGGRTLAQVAAVGLALDRVFRVLGQLVDALEAAHLVDIVHRDVKPANVMLQPLPSNPDFVRLVDFGLAKFTEVGGSTRLAAGTPLYMPPEQIARRQIGPWTDWYAVGVIAFQLLAGTQPYAGDSTMELVEHKMRPDFRPTEQAFAAHLPVDVREPLARMLSHDPTGRAADGAEVRALLKTMHEAMRAAVGGDFVCQVVSHDWNQPTSRPEGTERRTLRMAAPVVLPRPAGRGAVSSAGARLDANPPEMGQRMASRLDIAPPVAPGAVPSAGSPPVQAAAFASCSAPVDGALDSVAPERVESRPDDVMWIAEGPAPRRVGRVALFGAAALGLLLAALYLWPTQEAPVRVETSSEPAMMMAAQLAGTAPSSSPPGDAEPGRGAADARAPSAGALDAGLAALDARADPDWQPRADTDPAPRHVAAVVDAATPTVSPPMPARRPRPAASAADRLAEGQRLLEAARWALAERAFLDAMASDRHKTSALRGLAEVAHQRMDRKTALWYIDKALSREPSRGEYGEFRGRMLYLLDDLEGACRAWQSASQAHSPSGLARRHIARHCMRSPWITPVPD